MVEKHTGKQTQQRGYETVNTPAVRDERMELKVFDKEEFGRVRIVMKDGEPWFVAKDVCDCLKLGNPYTSIALLDEDEKGFHIVETPGGTQEMSVISEAGMYSLVLRSRKPEAKDFKRWVTHDILPSIRKTGQYGDYALPRIPKSFPEALRMIADIEEEKALAIEQRDFYKRTKAQIGSRREATAMSTAARFAKENASLRNAIGVGKTWKQVRAIEWLPYYFRISHTLWAQVGKKLTALSTELGRIVRRHYTSEYPEGVGLYHADVIAEFRRRLDTHPDMLHKYRRYDLSCPAASGHAGK